MRYYGEAVGLRQTRVWHATQSKCLDQANLCSLNHSLPRRYVSLSCLLPYSTFYSNYLSRPSVTPSNRTSSRTWQLTCAIAVTIAEIDLHSHPPVHGNRPPRNAKLGLESNKNGRALLSCDRHHHRIATGLCSGGAARGAAQWTLAFQFGHDPGPLSRPLCRSSSHSRATEVIYYGSRQGHGRLHG